MNVRAGNIDTGPQFSMEFMVLTELFPEEYLAQAEINILVAVIIVQIKTTNTLEHRPRNQQA